MTWFDWSRRPSPFTGFGDDQNTSVKFVWFTGWRDPNPDWQGGDRQLSYHDIGNGQPVAQAHGYDPLTLELRLWFETRDERDRMLSMVGQPTTLRIRWGVTGRAGGTKQTIGNVDYLILPDTILESLSDRSTPSLGFPEATATFRRPYVVPTFPDHSEPYPTAPYPLAPLHAPLEVMDTPPTVTVGANNGSSVIAGSADVTFGNAAFTYFGIRAAQGSGFPNDLVYSPLFAASLGTIYSTGRWGVEFEYDGSELELWMKRNGAAARYRLTVDGEGYESQAGHAGETTGDFYLVHYDFGSAADRRIRFDFAGNFGFLGIKRESGATVTATTRDLGPKVVIMGDSFTEGSNADAQYSMFADRLEQHMGWYDVAASGQGSTGYVEDGSYVSFDTRLQQDVIDAAPDVVIFAGGINDQTAYVEATFETRVDAIFDEIATDIPAATVIVLGPFWPDGDPVGNIMRIRDSLRQEALAHGFTFIDNIGGTVPYTGTEADYLNTGWMTGTGHVGDEQGDGNADTYTSADGTHPTQAGHDYLGQRIAFAIAAAHPELVQP